MLSKKKKKISKTKGNLVKKLEALQEENKKLKRDIRKLQADLKIVTVRLKEKEKAFYRIVEKNEAGILVVDDNGVVLYGNDSSKLLFDMKKKKIVGYNLGIPLTKKDKEEIQIMRQNGIFGTGEMLFSETKWEGKHAFLVMIRDITDRKKIETMKDNIIRDVAHSLKTPIAMAEIGQDLSIKGMREKNSRKIEEGQQMIRSSLREARFDVENILGLCGLLMGKGRKVDRRSLKKVLEKITENAKESAKRKNIKLEINVPDDADKFFFNEAEIAMLLFNLIDNAIKFTGSGKIRISARRVRENIKIRVKDTGRGMSAADQERIFDKFFQHHPSLPGVGIGMSICKEIAHRYDGKIDVFSKGEGKGTTVVVTLKAGKNKSKLKER